MSKQAITDDLRDAVAQMDRGHYAVATQKIEAALRQLIRETRGYELYIHHALHGDMDGTTCLRSQCSEHYPASVSRLP